MSSCLSCSELETLICDLALEITADGCANVVKEDGDTVMDGTPGLKAKIEVLKTYKSLYSMKNCGAQEELFEFVHVACVQPSTCEGSGCTTVPVVRNQRRYRR